jgi:hypothetical protein
LDANGDRERSSFEFVNNKGHLWWDLIGSIDSKDESYQNLFLNTSNIIWPNSQQGAAYAQNYAVQYVPLCPAGSEPILKGSTYHCETCRVGFFKPDVGSEPCSMCPEGADCNDVGIVVPCILPGYWRPEPPAGEEGDFSKWEVFRCDLTHRCLGGCQLNATCAMNVKQDSPVCAVCEHGYYALRESCEMCPASSSPWVAMEYFIIVFFILLVIAALVGLYALQIYSILGINVFYSAKDEPQDLKLDDDEDSTPRYFRSSSRLARSMGYASVIFNLIKARGLYVTVKLTLSFLQVLMGTIPRLNIEWTTSVSSLVNFADLNPMNYFPILSGCATTHTLHGPFVHIILVASVPLAFLVALGSVKWIMQQLLRRNAPKVLENNVSAVEKAMFDVTLKALVWFCLFSFPLLTAG